MNPKRKMSFFLFSVLTSYYNVTAYMFNALCVIFKKETGNLKVLKKVIKSH